METDNVFRQVRLPAPSEPGRHGPSGEPPSWSARRTALTMTVLLVGVAGIWWWAQKPARELERSEPGRPSLVPAGTLPPIDLPATNAALKALEGWGQMSWQQKREATHVIERVFDLGGTEYVIYIEVNRGIIQDHLEMRKQAELIRQARAASAGN